MSAAKSPRSISVQFWALTGLLLLVFLTGGATRLDVQSLVILRPISILACGFALITLRPEHLNGRSWLLGGLAAGFILTGLYLLPLPPGSHGLLGRDIISEVDQLTGIGDTWRPLTLTSISGWQAMLSLFAPLAVLLLGVQLSRDDLYRLLLVLIGLGALSGMFGLLQIIGDPEGPLYLYRLTNFGSAVGLFANRNHAAVLLACLFPMLAAFASVATGDDDKQKARVLTAASIAIVLLPLILVTGSRSGVLIAALGLSAAALSYRPAKNTVKRRRGGTRFKVGVAPMLGGLAVICLGFLTIFFSRAVAIDRLFEPSAAEGRRGDFWVVSLELFWKYFPLGSGPGSFAETFQVHQPIRLLSADYLNRAHNDWIETAVTLGIPGLFLLSVALIFYVRKMFGLWRHNDGNRRSVAFARMAGIVIFMIALASFFDYPLRTPIMMCFMAVLTLWFVEAGRHTKSDLTAENRYDENYVQTT